MSLWFAHNAILLSTRSNALLFLPDPTVRLFPFGLSARFSHFFSFLAVMQVPHCCKEGAPSSSSWLKGSVLEGGEAKNANKQKLFKCSGEGRLPHLKMHVWKVILPHILFKYEISSSYPIYAYFCILNNGCNFTNLKFFGYMRLLLTAGHVLFISV